MIQEVHIYKLTNIHINHKLFNSFIILYLVSWFLSHMIVRGEIYFLFQVASLLIPKSKERKGGSSNLETSSRPMGHIPVLFLLCAFTPVSLPRQIMNQYLLKVLMFVVGLAGRWLVRDKWQTVISFEFGTTCIECFVALLFSFWML